MNRWQQRLLLCLIVMQCCCVRADDASRMRFVGEGNGRTAVFETTGPWMLDWSTRSKSLLEVNFELRLYDAATGEFIGPVVQRVNTGDGLKLFEKSGEYQIVIVASNVAWELEISEVSAEVAARIRRQSEGEATLEDLSQQTLRRVREGSFSTWRPDGNDALLLFDENGPDWRATFSEPCVGLDSATAISFVTAIGGSLEEYDSILLDDGTRCHFDRVVPAFLD